MITDSKRVKKYRKLRICAGEYFSGSKFFSTGLVSLLPNYDII